MVCGTLSSVIVKSFSVNPSIVLPSLSLTITVSTTSCVSTLMVNGCCCWVCAAGITSSPAMTDKTSPLTRGLTYLTNPALGFRGNLKLDESCISDPKSEISDWTGPDQADAQRVQFAVSDFGSEMQDLSNFEMSSLDRMRQVY